MGVFFGGILTFHTHVQVSRRVGDRTYVGKTEDSHTQILTWRFWRLPVAITCNLTNSLDMHLTDTERPSEEAALCPTQNQMLAQFPLLRLNVLTDRESPSTSSILLPIRCLKTSTPIYPSEPR